MTNNTITVFCVEDGESSPFPVDIESSKTIGHFKDAIKAKLKNRLEKDDASYLNLWRVSIPNERKAVDLGSLSDTEKKELRPAASLHTIFEAELPKDTIHVIVQRPLTAAKRRPKDELENPQKLPKIDNKYDAKDGPVDLPPVLVSVLNSGQFKPAPRYEFKQQLDNIQVGQQIKLPSIGQLPKHFGKGYQEQSFFVTEQMLEMWRLLSGDSDHPIRRVLSCPMGVGKSYLALFLAAKAYAEGWHLLYFSDANDLNKATSHAIAHQICLRFLALNKDILTVDDFEELLYGNRSNETEVLS